MVYTLAYRRPLHSSASRDSLSGDDKQKSINESITSGNSCMSNGIPPALSFDRIIENGTCPPLTLRDFMNYLRYIEHSAENLQFFLWYRSYSERWQKLAGSERCLSPEWTSGIEGDAHAVSPGKPRRVPPQIAEVLKNTDFDDAPKTTIHSVDPFNTPSKSGSLDDRQDIASDYGSSVADEKTLFSSASSGHRTVTDQAFDDAGMKWKPFTAQPYRDEISRIISIYIAEGSPRELNLSGRERQQVLHALQHTTHPSAFRYIVRTVEYSLRKQAHPNFVRWTICNGNRPRVLFARGLGMFLVVAAFVADVLITLSHAGRGWRVLPIFVWFIGISTLIAAWKGMCVVLHGLHHRHLRPWELFSDEPEAQYSEKLNMSDESLVSGTANSFEEEPWIPRYNNRNVVRKIFDRQIWVQEPALRQIQDTIFLQSCLGALLLSGIVVGVFCAVPLGNLY